MLEKYQMEIIYGLGGLSAILLVLVIINMNRIKKLKNRFDKMAGYEDIDLEKLLGILRKDINDIHTGNILREEKIAKLEQAYSFTINKVGFYRYNALANEKLGRGGDLSFSIAFLYSYYNGFILTSIYAGSQSISYAKPIRNKGSNIPLSEEELIAIDKAIRGDIIE